MSPLSLFLRTLLRSSAICLGASIAIIHPPAEWPSSRPATAQQSPTEAATSGLIRALEDTDARVRRQAAVALGELRSRRAVPDLIETLADPDPDVREAAMRALKKIGDRRAGPALSAAIESSN